MKKLMMIFALLLYVATTQAQDPAPGTEAQAAFVQPSAEPDSTYPDLLQMPAEAYANLRLPPLHQLLENARERSPKVNQYAADQEYEERELKTRRRSWLRTIRLNSSFSYGTTDTNSQLFYENQYPVVQNVSGVTQRWWNVGASIALPLDEIFNRGNRNKQQQKRIESVQYEMENWYDEVCLKIIESYTAAVEGLSILRPVARAMVVAQAQYETAEADFINGKIDAQTLSRQKNIESDAIRQYEQTRAEINRSILQLEVLSKTLIISQPRSESDTKK